MSKASPEEAQGFRRHLRALHRRTKNHFIPHRGNNYKPHILRHGALLGYSLFLILLKGAVIVIPIVLPYADLFSSAITPKNIIELTNENRKALKLPLLKENPVLNQAAQVKAQDMLKNQYFAHISPSGTNAMMLMQSKGYYPKYGGENLAVHFSTAEETTGGWMASPSHRTNILNPQFTEIGIGIANGDFEGAPSTFVVQFFGTPKQTKTVSPASSITSTPIFKAETIQGTTTSTRPLRPQVALEENSVQIKSGKQGYAISLIAPQAKQVQIHIGNETKDLKQEPQNPEQWSGTIQVNTSTMNIHGETLNAFIIQEDGTTSATALALTAPSNDIRDIYVFQNRPRDLSFFGRIQINQLENTTRKTFIFFMVFLGMALLVNIFVKIHIQHNSIITHTLAVIGLAFLLFIM